MSVLIVEVVGDEVVAGPPFAGLEHARADALSTTAAPSKPK